MRRKQSQISSTTLMLNSQHAAHERERRKSSHFYFILSYKFLMKLKGIRTHSLNVWGPHSTQVDRTSNEISLVLLRFQNCPNPTITYTRTAAAAAGDNECVSKLSNNLSFFKLLIYFAIKWIYVSILFTLSIDLTSPDYGTWVIVSCAMPLNIFGILVK